MKQILIKISSFSMALLVLFSTFSFTVEKHYCGGFLIDVSYSGNAKVCKTDIALDYSVKMKSCCKDEVFNIEGQDELQQASDLKIDFKNQQFLTAFFVSYQGLFNENKSKNTRYKDFHPPDTCLDYQVLYQAFLI